MKNAFSNVVTRFMPPCRQASPASGQRGVQHTFKRMPIHNGKTIAVTVTFFSGRGNIEYFDGYVDVKVFIRKTLRNIFQRDSLFRMLFGEQRR